MSDDVENARLLSIAESISDRQPVDWADLHQQVSPEHSAVVEQLRLLETVARLGEDVPLTWGPYAIAGEIGRGAFGTVYRAYDPDLERNVALKVIRPVPPDAPFDPEKALDEARRLARVEHDNVVRILRVDRLGDEVGISMELIDGQTLNALVQERGPYSSDEATVIGLDLCRALAAVHGTDTLHGDVKAHNVMRSAGGRIVLTDFGTGKDLSRAPGQGEGDFAGTPLYLAPEVFSGASRTRASDIYSLGVLLYYLVSGTYPVEGSTKSEVGRQHAETTSRRLLRDVRPDLPEPFVRVVEQALAEDPQQRHQSAGAFEAALRGAQARPGPLPSRAPLKTLLLVAAVVTLAGSALLIRNLWTDARDTRSGTDASDVPTTTVVPLAAGAYSVDAAIYREEHDIDARLAPGTRVSVGDKLSLHLRASVPTYVYVVNEDEAGESYLLFPLPGKTDSNPLSPDQIHRLPGTRKDEHLSWKVTSAGIREHFVIFVSPERSATFEKLFASLAAPAGDGPLAVRLPAPAVEGLRGIGGVVASAVTGADQGIRRVPAFTTPLPLGGETAQGLWVRQIAFENPASR